MDDSNVSVRVGGVEGDGLGLTEGLGEGKPAGRRPGSTLDQGQRQADRSDSYDDNGRHGHLQEVMSGREAPRHADDHAPLSGGRR